MFETLFSSPAALLDRHPVSYLNAIWKTFFADVPRVNTVEIAYGKSWKSRLGSIRLRTDGTVSRIALNALLSRAEVPIVVLVTTIGHELSHYAHGFGSPLPRLHPHPHANGVVTHELEKRGLGEARRQCNKWIAQEWYRFSTPFFQAGWPEHSLAIDMAVPPTLSQCLAITLSLQSGAWYQPTQTPLTEAEALWLQGYLAYCFPQQQVQTLLVTAEPHAEAGERRFALDLSLRGSGSNPIYVASFSDWKRLQSWAVAPFRFEQVAHSLSKEQQAREWKRVQLLRDLIFAVAQISPATCLSQQKEGEESSC